MKVFKVYKITNLLTKKHYIGQTSMTVKDRWRYHYKYRSQCSYLHNSINKYGVENFKVEWIASAISEEYIDDLEDFFIKSLDTLCPNGYNLKLGGSHPTMCDATKQKMSKSQKEKNTNMTKEEKDIQYRGLYKYIENKKRPVIGINQNYEIVQFRSGQEARDKGFYLNTSLMDNTSTAKGYFFFYEGEYTFEEMYEIITESLKTKKINLESGREKAKSTNNNTIESQTHRYIVAVNPETRDVLFYKNGNRARIDGHSVSSIDKSLKRDPENPGRSRGYHFFYKEKHTIDEMFKLAEETNTLIHERYIKGRKKAVANMKEHIDAQKTQLIGINPKTLEYRVFESWAEAKREKYSADAIRRGIRGEKRTTKKLHFQYFTTTPQEHIEITKEIYK